jgi:hypothetical protein
MAKNVSEEFVEEVLGRRGDRPPPGDARARYGRRGTLRDGGPGLDFVALDAEGEAPRPYRIQLRCREPGGVWSSIVPAGWILTVMIQRGVSRYDAPVIDTYDLDGDTGAFLPLCGFGANSLTVSIRANSDGDPLLEVECNVIPVTNVDCADLQPGVPAASGFLGFDNVSNTTLPVLVFPATGNRPANPLRKYLAIQNRSDAALAISLGSFMDWTPGSEATSIILPPNISAIWEAPTPMYRGIVTVSNDPTGGTTGYTLITEGQ